MPTGKKNRMPAKNSPSTLRRRATVVPTSLIAYKGPISIPPTDQTVVCLLDNATVICSAAGAILLNFNNNPSAARNWSEMATAWGEYRVLGIKLKYSPIGTVNTATAPGFSGYQSVVHALTAPAPASLAQAASTGISRPWNAFRPFVRTWRMSDPEESLFQATSAPSLTAYAFSLYGEGGGVSQYYGNLSFEYLVQFKQHTL